MSKRCPTTRNIVYNLPFSSVKICGHKYRVYRHPSAKHNVEEFKGEPVFGYHSTLPRRLGLAYECSPQQCHETLWHEFLEAIVATHDINIKHRDLTTIANELWRIHVENKWKQFSR